MEKLPSNFGLCMIPDEITQSIEKKTTQEDSNTNEIPKVDELSEIEEDNISQVDSFQEYLEYFSQETYVQMIDGDIKDREERIDYCKKLQTTIDRIHQGAQWNHIELEIEKCRADIILFINRKKEYLCKRSEEQTVSKRCISKQLYSKEIYFGVLVALLPQVEYMDIKTIFNYIVEKYKNTPEKILAIMDEENQLKELGYSAEDKSIGFSIVERESMNSWIHRIGADLIVIPLKDRKIKVITLGKKETEFFLETYPEIIVEKILPCLWEILENTNVELLENTKRKIDNRLGFLSAMLPKDFLEIMGRREENQVRKKLNDFLLGYMDEVGVERFTKSIKNKIYNEKMNIPTILFACEIISKTNKESLVTLIESILHKTASLHTHNKKVVFGEISRFLARSMRDSQFTNSFSKILCVFNQWINNGLRGKDPFCYVKLHADVIHSLWELEIRHSLEQRRLFIQDPEFNKFLTENFNAVFDFLYQSSVVVIGEDNIKHLAEITYHKKKLFALLKDLSVEDKSLNNFLKFVCRSNIYKNPEVEQDFQAYCQGEYIGELEKQIAILIKDRNCHIQAGNWESALVNQEKIIDLNPNVSGYINYAYMFYQAGKWEKVFGCYQKALKIDLNSQELKEEIEKWQKILIDIRQQNINKQDWEKALIAQEHIIEINPTASGYSNRATMLHHLGKLKESIENYKYALKIDPNFVDAKEDLEILKKKLSEE